MSDACATMAGHSRHDPPIAVCDCEWRAFSLASPTLKWAISPIDRSLPRMRTAQRDFGVAILFRIHVARSSRDWPFGDLL